MSSFGIKTSDRLMWFTQQTPVFFLLFLLSSWTSKDFPPSSPGNHPQSPASAIRSDEYFITMQRFPPSQCVIKCTQRCGDFFFLRHIKSHLKEESHFFSPQCVAFIWESMQLSGRGGYLKRTPATTRSTKLQPLVVMLILGAFNAFRRRALMDCRHSTIRRLSRNAT